MAPPHALGSLVGGWIAATVTGGLLGRVGSGMLTELWGWRASFVVFAALTLLCALLCALALPPDTRPRAASWRRAYGGMLAHLRNRRLLGAFLIGGALFFGFIGVFTYLPYYLSGAPFFLSPGLVSLLYLAYLAGVVVSPVAGRLSRRVGRRALMAVGLGVAMLGVAGTLAASLPLIVASLFVLCSGMFTAQAVAPAFVNATAREAKGGASALYLTCYYIGGTLGAVVPGWAWQALGWPGVTTVCLLALLLALLADWLLCGERASGR
jgi:MFS transporter, YNFM family, putative membrane transport protein